MKKNILISEATYEKARKKIQASQKDTKIIFTSDNDDLSRKILEKQNIEILLINQTSRKDFQKQRNSGLNHVLAKIAKKNKIGIGINFDEIISSERKDKTRILSRIKQNIMLCNKNKINMHFIAQKSKNQRNLHDLKALGSILGMPTWMTKNINQITF